MTSRSWPLRPGLHVLQWRIQREAASREQADPIKCVVVRIESATRLHEVGIASNADQNATVNTFPGLVHRPSHHWEWVAKEVGSLTFGRALPLVIHDWGEVGTR